MHNVGNHLDEFRVVPHRLGAVQFDAAFLGDCPGFNIQIKKDFHVVGEEPGRNHQNILDLRFAGLGKPPDHILEGRSLMPLLRGGQPSDWRKVVFSEYDYCMQDVRLKLGQPIEQCRLFMVYDGRWKYIHASGFRPMLYDLQSDPDEFADLGEDPSCADVIARMQAALFDWALHPKGHITTSTEKIAAYAEKQLQVKGGILIGIWDEAELSAIRQKIGITELNS